MLAPTGSKATERKKRQAIRKRLREQGVDETEIERRVTLWTESRDMRRRHEIEAQQLQAHVDRQQLEDDTYKRLSPDDSRFRPRRRDPLLVGNGRATGVAAAAAKRGTTFTKWQVDQLETTR
jgi:predicted phosphoribosyltransferase